MRYLLLIYLEPGYLSPGDEVARAMNEEYRELLGLAVRERDAARRRGAPGRHDRHLGRRCATAGGSSPTARSRRPRSTSPGYYLIEAADLDAAIDAAARIPGARIGTVEVRPIQELV